MAKRRKKKAKKLTPGQKFGVGALAAGALGVGWWLWNRYRTGQAAVQGQSQFEQAIGTATAPSGSTSGRKASRGAAPRSTPGCPPPTTIIWPTKGSGRPTETASGLVIDIPQGIHLDEKARGIYGTPNSVPPMIHLSSSKPSADAILFGTISSRAADLRPLIKRIEQQQDALMDNMNSMYAKQAVRAGIGEVVDYKDVGKTLGGLAASDILSKSVAQWQQSGMTGGDFFDAYELNDFLCQIKFEQQEGIEIGNGGNA
jgi:hypothetical protein